MPRSGRLVLPGYPHRIVQRGHGNPPQMKGSVHRVWTALNKYNLNEGQCDNE